MSYELNLKNVHPAADAYTEQARFGDGPRFRKHISRRLVAGMVVVGLGIVALAWGFSGSGYRAVFLSNNQVYFGTFRDLPFWPTITLRDIYYLQAAQPLQVGSPSAPPEIKVIKLGSELHGPEDMMVIPKSQIVFWEDLKPSSPVVQSIKNMRTAAKK